MENLKIMKFVVMVNIIGLMEENILEDGLKIKCQEMELQFGLMEEFMRECMKVI